MDENTRLSLEADIALWNKNANAWQPDQYVAAKEDMALCQDFLIGVDDKCEGCPVKTFTGSQFCLTSPHMSALTARGKWKAALAKGKDGGKERIEAQNAARRMEDFLKSTHPDNAEEEDPTLPDLGTAVDAAISGRQIGVLCKYREVGRVLQMNLRKDPTVAAEWNGWRKAGRLNFKSGGSLYFMVLEHEWAGMELDQVFIHGVNPNVLGYQLHDLKQRFKK